MFKEIQVGSFQNSSANVETPPVIGIDLGTTNSLVAYVEQGKPRVLKTHEGKNILPSTISFVDNEVLIGESAKKNKIIHPELTVFSVKRLLGRSLEDVSESLKHLSYRLEEGENGVGIRVGEKFYSPIELSAKILKSLKDSAEKEIGKPVQKAVITVPAYFNDAQRQATRAAGRIAGLEVLRIINEPTAAALAYGIQEKKNGIVAVYDLGGGTFDISILQLHDGIFEVLSTHGNTHLGGDDLDFAIFEKSLAGLSVEAQTEIQNSREKKAKVLVAAEKAKIELSTHEFTEINIPELNIHFKFSQSDFEAWVLPILQKTKEACLQALQDAQLQIHQISDIILVGGPTRLPVVKKFVNTIFEGHPKGAQNSVHPDEVVAIGAAVQADILAGNNQDLLLLDVTPLSLGIETYGGMTSVLIPRNTRIPTSARDTYTTFVDRQTAIDIHVVQGERDKVEGNRSLARFKLKGIQPQPAGAPRIEVSFLIDADGILQVTATDLQTGKNQAVEVRPSFGMTDQEIEKMLIDSMNYAQQDIDFKSLVEARNKAEPVLRSTEKNISVAQRLLPPHEVQQIEECVKGLRIALEGSDVEKIQHAAMKLNQQTTTLAELLLKESLQS